MHRRTGSLAESMAVVGSATLAGIACCGPTLLQWLGFLVWAVGGRALLIGLVRYEIPILALIAAAAFLGRRLAPDRLTRWANALLVGVALLLAALRAIWELQRGLVMAVEPVYQLFIYRQALLLAAAGLVFIVRLGLLIIALWQRGRADAACPVPGRRQQIAADVAPAKAPLRVTAQVGDASPGSRRMLLGNASRGRFAP